MLSSVQRKLRMGGMAVIGGEQAGILERLEKRFE